MKFKKLLPSIFFAATFLVACGENSNEAKPISEEKTVVVEKAGEGEKTEIDVQTVPAPVKTTYDNKYAKAENVKWSSYKPVTADSLEMDNDYYYVTYRWNYIPYEAWYKADGNLVREEEIIYLPNSGDMPKAIVRSIMLKYPGYEIAEKDKENDKDIEMYEVELHKGNEKVKVRFLLNGEIYTVK